VNDTIINRDPAAVWLSIARTAGGEEMKFE